MDCSTKNNECQQAGYSHADVGLAHILQRAPSTRRIFEVNIFNINVKKTFQFEHNVEGRSNHTLKTANIKYFLQVELILHRAHHGTAHPLMSSSWKNIVVRIGVRMQTSRTR
jgi:hypothetical protein